jgi:uncharacterized membrane protein YoaK (UPF0700 family)
MAVSPPIFTDDNVSQICFPIFFRLCRHLRKPPPTPLQREFLLTLTVIQTGILDASIYVSLGHAFVANMTGNIVLLGLAISDLETDVLPNLIALISFFVGGYLTGICERTTRQPDGGHSRLFFATLTLTHSLLDFIAAALVYSDVIVTQPSGDMRLIIFAILSLGQGSQLVLTKRAGLPEFSNAVITNPFVDLSTDPKLFHFLGDGVRGRNRRAIGILGLFVGSIMGAQIVKLQTLGIALLLAAGMSCITAIGWSL